MELKQETSKVDTKEAEPFNQTSMELKLLQVQYLMSLSHPFNQTSMELKHLPV